MRISFHPRETNNNMDLAEDFFSYVSPEPNSGCWLWMGHVDTKGYGRICKKYMASLFGKKHALAHRYSYLVHYGVMPPQKMSVCHRCDVPSCVNSDHLFLGTQQDNAIDMVKKGRANRVKGEKHYLAKITDEQVREIRSSPLRPCEYQRVHGVSRHLVSNIRRGKNRNAA